MNLEITDGALGVQAHVVEPHGEIDLATAAELKQRLEAVIASGAATIIVDLSDVAFIDSTGIGVLLSVQRRITAGEREMVTICPDPLVRRIFEVAGLLDVLRVVGTRRDAIALAHV